MSYEVMIANGTTTTGLFIQENWHSIKIDGIYNTNILEVDDTIQLITPSKIENIRAKRIWDGTIYGEKENFYSLDNTNTIFEIENKNYKFQKDTNKPIDTLNLTLSWQDSIHLDPHDIIRLNVNSECKFDGHIVTYDQINNSIKAYNFLNEFKHIPVRKKYISQSIEYIIKDLVETYTSYTVNYTTDTTTINRFFAAGYLLDVLNILLGVGGYVTIVSENSITLVKPTTTIEGTLVNDNGAFTNSQKDTEQLSNNVLIQGKTTQVNTSETGSLSNEDFFELNHIVSGGVNVTLNGTELTIDTDYTVDDVGGGIRFTSPRTGTVVVTYNYDRHLLARYQDLDSITKYGMKSSEYSSELLDDDTKINDIGYNIIMETSDVLSNITLETKERYFEIGNTYTLYNKRFNIDENLICTSYILSNMSEDAPVTANFSKTTDDLFNKYASYDAAIADLERLFKQDEPDINYTTTNKTTLIATESLTQVWDLNVDVSEIIEDNAQLHITITNDSGITVFKPMVQQNMVLNSKVVKW